MDDLISRQMTIDLLDRYFVNPPEYMKDYSDKLLHAIKDDLVDDVNSMPSAEPERKTGRWIENYGDSKCSECGYVLKIYDTNYCPDCGSYNGGGANEID